MPARKESQGVCGQWRQPSDVGRRWGRQETKGRPLRRGHGLQACTRLRAAHRAWCTTERGRISWWKEKGGWTWLSWSLCYLTLPSPQISVSSLKHWCSRRLSPLCLSVQVLLEWLCTQAFNSWHPTGLLNLNLLCHHPNQDQTHICNHLDFTIIISIMSRIQLASPSPRISHCPYFLMSPGRNLDHSQPTSHIHTYDTPQIQHMGLLAVSHAHCPWYSAHLPETSSFSPSSRQVEVSPQPCVQPFIGAPPCVTTVDTSSAP